MTLEEELKMRILEWRANYYKSIAQTLDICGGIAIFLLGILVLYLVNQLK
jgi:hypothetical protein